MGVRAPEVLTPNDLTDLDALTALTFQGRYNAAGVDRSVREGSGIVLVAVRAT